ncbi:UNVERIFIED_CONTAM: hypothetical protein Sradi_5506800 [Sesamum radiatum]|uniref:Uncharacterized protein n=1 Tax=Sesamum radiatum TaxID=300843 RepID=A0AAW2LEW3_SESRA
MGRESKEIFRVLISAEVSGRRRRTGRRRRRTGSLPISTVRRTLNAAVARRRSVENEREAAAGVEIYDNGIPKI